MDKVEFFASDACLKNLERSSESLSVTQSIAIGFWKVALLFLPFVKTSSTVCKMGPNEVI